MAIAVADAGAVGSPSDVRQIGRVDLQQGKVRRRVAADDAGGIFLAVGQGDGDRVDRAGAGKALDQMVVGDDIAVGRDDEA